MVVGNDYLHMVIRRTCKFRSWKKTGERTDIGEMKDLRSRLVSRAPEPPKLGTKCKSKNVEMRRSLEVFLWLMSARQCGEETHCKRFKLAHMVWGPSSRESGVSGMEEMRL